MDEHTLGYADFRGNRQYVSIGNVAGNDRVSLFLMDYAHQRRLKIFGRMRVVDARTDPELAEKVTVLDYPGRVERAILITVEAFDWNCPQHITPRFTELEIREALAPVHNELAVLRAENDRLRRELRVASSQSGTAGVPA
jgi:predicted pyridoxine 5'-phosphate oxidase superfamily flavin-nucleotide-binding protein